MNGREAAELLGVSQVTIYSHINSGTIRAHKTSGVAKRCGGRWEIDESVLVDSPIRANRSTTMIRAEEFEFLLESGMPLTEAVKRAGWPSMAAAAKALYRIHHPLATRVSTEEWRTRRTAAIA